MKKIAILSACLFLIIQIKAQDKKPPPPPPPPPAKVDVKKVVPAPPKVDITRFVPPTREQQEFYKQNPDVARIYWKSENNIVVLHKNKSRFVYNMKDEKEKTAFKEKYGDMPLTSPPRPPVIVDVKKYVPPPPPPPKENKD